MLITSSPGHHQHYILFPFRSAGRRRLYRKIHCGSVASEQIDVPGNIENRAIISFPRGQNQLFDVVGQNLTGFGRFGIECRLKVQPLLQNKIPDRFHRKSDIQGLVCQRQLLVDLLNFGLNSGQLLQESGGMPHLGNRRA
ncbi:hypothetical protein [Silvibacterium dinghuense]|uniref:Uncharacterized protein n=1 Tax=Silvibacterium dinghuense TaxID=1560006 RepID=A0A4Q1SJB3_9BACT|nr:hypothetical protein [Silvibacterium dinghuense]RXS97519.1 hypothetical protein ESZ00_06410 [Silvibacterium dinghuense]